MEILQNPLTWLIAGAALLFGPKWPPLLAKLKAILASVTPSPEPVPQPPAIPYRTVKVLDDISVEHAVTHYLALRAYCKDCPEAESTLISMWRHIEPGSHRKEDHK